MSDESMNIQGNVQGDLVSISSRNNSSKSDICAMKIKENASSEALLLEKELNSLNISKHINFSNSTVFKVTNATHLTTSTTPNIFAGSPSKSSLFTTGETLHKTITTVPKQTSSKISFLTVCHPPESMFSHPPPIKKGKWIDQIMWLGKSLASDFLWPLEMNLDFYVSMHEILHNVNKEKDLPVGWKILIQQPLTRSPFVNANLESSVDTPTFSVSKNVPAAHEIATEMHSKDCFKNNSSKKTSISHHKQIDLFKIFKNPMYVQIPPRITRLLSSPENEGINRERHIRRIDSLTALLYRIIHFDNYLASNPLVEVRVSPEKVCNPECETFPPPLEETFIRNLCTLLENSPRDCNVSEFLTCLRDMVQRLDNLVEAECYDDLIFTKTRFYTDEPLFLEELNIYLPKFWKMARFNNMLLKQLALSFLIYTLKFKPLDSIQEFYNVERKAQTIEVQVTDIHRSTSRLINRWRNPLKNNPKILELQLIIAFSNVSYTIYKNLANVIILTRMHLGK